MITTNILTLARKQLKANFFSWDHSSSYFWIFIAYFVAEFFQVYFQKSGGNNPFESKILIFWVAMGIFSFYVIPGFGWLLYDNITRQIKTGEYLLLFSNRYTRKEVMLSKLLVIYVEFTVFMIVTYLSIFLSPWIANAIPVSNKTNTIQVSQIWKFQLDLLIVIFSFSIFAYAIYLPLMVYMSYKLRPYWFVIGLVILECVGMLFILPNIIFSFAVSAENRPAQYENIKRWTLGVGTISPFFWPLFLIGLIDQSFFRPVAGDNVIQYFRFFYGLNGDNIFYTSSEKIGFGLYLLAVSGFGLFTLFDYQKSFLKKLWIT